MYFIPFNIKTHPFTETIEMCEDDGFAPKLVVVRTYKFKTYFTARQAFTELNALGLNCSWASADCKSVKYYIFINLDGKGVADMYSYDKFCHCKWNTTHQN